MKKTISFILILISISISKSFAQSDPAYSTIASLNLDYYAGLPVDSFLHKIPQSYTSMDLYGVLKNDKVGGLWIEYASGMNIIIKPMQYHFMNPIAPNNGWDLTLFKKETAYFITVIHPDFPTLTGKYMVAVEKGK